MIPAGTKSQEAESQGRDKEEIQDAKEDMSLGNTNDVPTIIDPVGDRIQEPEKNQPA